jgi:hypothetical protein
MAPICRERARKVRFTRSRLRTQHGRSYLQSREKEFESKDPQPTMDPGDIFQRPGPSSAYFSIAPPATFCHEYRYVAALLATVT